MNRCCFVVACCLLFAGCREHTTVFDYSDFTHVVKKGKFELYVPDYLRPDKHLNKQADLQYSDSLNTTFLLIIREEIPDLSDDSIEITLPEYLSYATSGIVESMEDVSADNDTISSINEAPALSAVLSGEFAGIDLYYRITVLRDRDYFYQVILWTIDEMKAEREMDFLAATISFKLL